MSRHKVVSVAREKNSFESDLIANSENRFSCDIIVYYFAGPGVQRQIQVRGMKLTMYYI